MTTWSGSVGIKKRMADGEVYDLVIVGAPEIDAFIQEGKIVPGSRVDLMKSGVGVAVRAGAERPDVSSSDALKKTLLDTKSIGYSTGPSGVHVARLLERMGITDQVNAKLKQTSSGVAVGTIIASGEAEIGFQQVSELIHFPGIDYVGPLPEEVQNITVFSAGIHSEAKRPEAAKDSDAWGRPLLPIKKKPGECTPSFLAATKLVANPHVANVPIAELVDDHAPSEKTFSAIVYVIRPISVPAVRVSVSSAVITSADRPDGQSGCQSGTEAEATTAAKTTTSEPTTTSAMESAAVESATTSPTAKAPRIGLTRQSHRTRNRRDGKGRNS